MTMEINQMDAHEIVREIRSGRITVQEVVRSHLDRIEARDGEISAFASIDPTLAMTRARAMDEGKLPSGDLAGVPFAIKDIIDTCDFPVTMGSPIHSDRRPLANASCVDLCLQAGAIPLGTSISTEFACFTPGPTRNPANPEHTPGGSSSGSAAAVSDHMVPFGLGSQTAASLIRPAAYCGVYSYKSSHGSIDTQGVMSLAPGLDSLGIFARCAEDLALLRSVLQPGIAPSNAFQDTPPRIMLMRGYNWDRCSPAGQSACMDFCHDLDPTGAHIEEIDCPVSFRGLDDAHATIMGYELVRTRSAEYVNHRDQLSGKFANLYESCLNISLGEYQSARKLQQSCLTVFADLFHNGDIIVTPASPGEAPPGLGSTGDPLFSRTWTLLHAPAVARPFGTGPTGLPLSVQLIGPPNYDARLLEAACWMDRHLKQSRI